MRNNILLILIITIYPITLLSHPQNKLHEINKYLSSFTTMKANFTEWVNQNEYRTGSIYIARPSKMLIEYDKPRIKILLDGKDVVLHNQDLNQVSYATIEPYLTNIFLNPSIDIAKLFANYTIDENTQYITIEGQLLTNSNNKNIMTKYVFKQHPMSIYSTEIKFSEKHSVYMEWKDIEINAPIPNNIFYINDPRINKHRIN